MAVMLRSVEAGHLQSNIQTDNWCFVYCRSGNVWKGELAEEEIKSSALEVGQDVKEYSETATNVFAKSCENYSIDLSDSHDDVIELSWKKHTGTGVKYALGTVKLQKCDSSEIDAVLSNASEQILTLQNELALANSKSDEIEKENERMASLLKKFAEQKVETESELFTKFILILNEKKAKIRNLKEELGKSKSRSSNFIDENIDVEVRESETVSHSPKQNNKKNTKLAKKIPHDDSLTGESENLLAKIPKRTNRTRTRATVISSTSKQNTSKSKNVSELSDSDEENMECDDTIDAAEMVDGL